MTCTEKYYELYKSEADDVAFCPYRVCPLGAHVDHQHGKITGFAIDRGIHIAYSPVPNGIVELTSLQFEKRVIFHVNSVSKTKVGDWADYLRGAVIELKKIHSIENGINGVIEGSMPIGGLSSSAAVTISFLSALCRANSITLRPEEITTIAINAENKYVGVSSGKLDQYCEVYSKKDKLLYIDTLDDKMSLISAGKAMKPYEIMILFSGIERTLAGSKYNMRVDECKSAAYALKAFSGMEYGKYNETYLRDVPYEVFLKNKDKLPENWRKRAEHFYSENERVVKGIEAWKNGDLEEFGKLVFQSGESSIYNYETGSDELKALYDLMKQTDGVYGGRFSGAGFRGCCMGFVDPDFKESIKNQITEKYIKQFPALADKFQVYFCKTADGVAL